MQVALIVLLFLAHPWDPSTFLLAVAMRTLMEMPQLLVVPALLVVLIVKVLSNPLGILSLLLSSLLAFAQRANMLQVERTIMGQVVKDAQLVRLEKQLPITTTTTTVILVI